MIYTVVTVHIVLSNYGDDYFINSSLFTGSFDEAREVLKKSEDFLPDYVLLRIHRIALEVRQKSTLAAEDLYKESIASCRHWDREARCFWVCRYARFMSQVSDVSMATASIAVTLVL